MEQVLCSLVEIILLWEPRPMHGIGIGSKHSVNVLLGVIMTGSTPTSTLVPRLVNSSPEKKVSLVQSTCYIL